MGIVVSFVRTKGLLLRGVGQAGGLRRRLRGDFQRSAKTLRCSIHIGLSKAARNAGFSA
jgi:hypothetical protein